MSSGSKTARMKKNHISSAIVDWVLVLERLRRSSILLIVVGCLLFLYCNLTVLSTLTFHSGQEESEDMPFRSESLAERELRLAYYANHYTHKPPIEHPGNYTQVKNNLCGPPPEYLSYFSQSKWVRSQFEEDKALYKTLFQGVFNKTFVELGAYEGIHWSNSRFFEECLGWTGMLIEASPAVFPRLVHNRPHTHRLNFAPSCEEMNASISFTNDAKPGSAAVGVSETNAQNTVTVPCGPLGPVLEDIMGGYVTLFSLDVEKSEPLVLKTINWSKVKVDVWVVESFTIGESQLRNQRNQETRDIFQSAGYRRYEGVVKKSDLYIHTTSLYQLPASYTVEMTNVTLY